MSKPESLMSSRAVIFFEVSHARDPNRDAAVRATFSISPRRYEKTLRAILNDPAVMAEFPNEVRRIAHRLQLDQARGALRGHHALVA